MNDITILPVSGIEVAAKWDVVEPLLAKALEVAAQRYWPVDILLYLLSGGGGWQAWMIREGSELLAILVTRIDVYPRKKGCNVFALAGSRMSEWFPQADEILSQYAKQNGCHFFECQGRRGWEKVLDLTPRAIYLIKELNDSTTEAALSGLPHSAKEAAM